jgi:hypothetical protein
MAETDQSAHLDIGFSLNRDREDTTIWDCASGFGRTKSEALSSAVEAWLQTTAPVVLELLTRQGTYAEHYSSANVQDAMTRLSAVLAMVEAGRAGLPGGGPLS